MCRHLLVLISWTISTNTLKVTNLPRSKFLIRCSVIYREGETQILSRFRAGLRGGLWTELLVREINELETAYALAQDLDSFRTNHTFRSHDYMTSMSRPSHLLNLIGLIPKSLHIGMTSRVRVLIETTKTKALSPPKLVSQSSATNVKVTNT